MLVVTARDFHAAPLAAIANCRRLAVFALPAIGCDAYPQTFFSRSEAFIVLCATPKMDAEAQKLVESGKLTEKAAEQLGKLKPGTFCLHKSWGFGRVTEWNLLLNQIVIDFQGRRAHPMQLQYAADNLIVIPSEHFLAKKATNLAAIQDLVKKDPALLVRNILESLGGAATQAQIG